MQNINDILKLPIFYRYTFKYSDYGDFLCGFINDDIDDKLAYKMVLFALSKGAHEATLNKIIKKQFKNLTASQNKVVHFVIGQSGAGKSSITKQILKDDKNFLKIDVDEYKKFNPLSKTIYQNCPNYYGYLTGIDSYLHKKEVEQLAINNCYNIITEISPTNLSDLKNSINLYKKNGYKIVVDIMCVSNINSLLSVHERYEKALKKKGKIVKLTDLNRAVNSYKILPSILNYVCLLNFAEVNLFVRYKKGCKKIMVDKQHLSNAYFKYNLLDKTKTLKTLDLRINNLHLMLKNRNASKSDFDNLTKTIKTIKKLTQKRGIKYE